MARRAETYELLPRTSIESAASSDADAEAAYAEAFAKSKSAEAPAIVRLLAAVDVRRGIGSLWRVVRKRSRRHRQVHRSRRACCCYVVAVCVGMLVAVVFVTAVFMPSYTRLPPHYLALRKSCRGSSRPGRGNVHNEKVFIAASLADAGGSLVRGAWGNAVAGLVDLLGPDNVFLSVYENDADAAAQEALGEFKEKLGCASSLVSEHLSLESLHRVTTPTGESRLKRIAFLAEVRNRALRPLTSNVSMQYDRILFLNDVIFDPIDAINLLFSSNQDASGRAQYGAVCALDFINPLKFYDTFATRDLDGYELGVPFYPWFTDAGTASSRHDVLAQKDAVRVRACWGGMTAFEARWFTDPKTDTRVPPLDKVVSPLRFRYELDPFWDSSECCLIHADLTYLRQGVDLGTDASIYTNPYVRVAYDARTLAWLPVIQRVERLNGFAHTVLNHLVGMPWTNPRREEVPGEEVVDQVWRWDGSRRTPRAEDVAAMKGSYHSVKRIARPGGFCGQRTLQVLNEDPRPGESRWSKVPLPAPPS